MDFKQKYQSFIDIINKYLDEYFTMEDLLEKSIYDSMKYSLMAGGKRVRPVLSIAVCDMLEGNVKEIIPFACAVEMIHTYSLIHDDLPSMDNDDYRRGRLTNHKVYGEALAILAGDGLLNSAFELMLEACTNGGNLPQKIKAMTIIANASGPKGMIAGQVIDMESENKEVSSDILERMHNCKTGALIKAPVLASAVVSNASQEELIQLERFAANLGLAFQIKDDILDIEGNSQKLGKNIGSDEANKKSTFVSIYGLEKSKEMLHRITGEAIESLSLFGTKGDFLRSFAHYLLIREN